MFSAFFGHYLLNEKIVTPRQLAKALDLQEITHLKLGTIAINADYMTAKQVEDVHFMQLTCDKRFGELAVESGYLTPPQVRSLLSTQESEHLLLAQCLVDLDILSLAEFDQHLHKYKEMCELTDTAFEELKANNVEAIIDHFLQLEDGPNSAFYKAYIILFIKNQVRFIHNSIRFGPMTLIKKNSYAHIIGQSIISNTNYFTAIAGDAVPLRNFAGIYAQEHFNSFDESPIDAIGEYMNQNNGLFIVNKSNEGMNLSMNIQRYIDSPTLNPYLPLYDIPMSCSFGEIHLILGEL